MRGEKSNPHLRRRDTLLISSASEWMQRFARQELRRSDRASLLEQVFLFQQKLKIVRERVARYEEFDAAQAPRPRCAHRHGRGLRRLRRCSCTAGQSPRIPDALLRTVAQWMRVQKAYLVSMKVAERGKSRHDRSMRAIAESQRLLHESTALLRKVPDAR